MDTDDLSQETYDTIITASERFNYDLTLQFGVLADECEDDNDYLEKAKELIVECQKDLEYAIDIIFFENPPDVKEFDQILKELTCNIDNTLKIPIDKRNFIDW